MKLNWGFGIAMVYALFAGGMILFAVKASQQKADLVTDNYYEEAVQFQSKIDAGNNTAKLGSEISIEYVESQHAVAITVEGKTKSVHGVLSFYKPDKATEDFKLAFSTDESGKQLLPVKNLAHGYWKVNGSWMVEGKDCFTEKKLFISTP